jgi:hypothetical protein
MRRILALADRYLAGRGIGLGVKFGGDTVAIGLTGCDWPAGPCSPVPE